MSSKQITPLEMASVLLYEQAMNLVG